MNTDKALARSNELWNAWRRDDRDVRAPEALVAIDWEGGHDIQPVLDRLAEVGALMGIQTGPYSLPNPGGDRVERTRHVVTFDRNMIRDTEAHGIGYRAGFVVHIEAVR